MIRKILICLIIGFTTLFSFISCSKSDNKLGYKLLNFEINCDKDSSFFYYTLNYERIYLDISTYSVTMKFSSRVSEEYLKQLVEQNGELDSIAFIYSESDSVAIIYGDQNLAYGYLKKEIHCEDVKSLLIRLTLEDQILCANPNFYLLETVLRGEPVSNTYDLVGLTDEFLVKLKDGIPKTVLASLISQTNTKLVDEEELYIVISADKYSKGNSLEMSQYFYESEYFEYSHPNFIMNPEPFR